MWGGGLGYSITGPHVQDDTSPCSGLMFSEVIHFFLQFYFVTSIKLYSCFNVYVLFSRMSLVLFTS